MLQPMERAAAQAKQAATEVAATARHGLKAATQGVQAAAAKAQALWSSIRQRQGSKKDTMEL